MIILGETKDKIALCADNKGFKNYTFVSNMREAVKKSYELAESGYNVLLSPACASWDMYESYEHRGNEFKELVNKL
jgi:UDP-N-acetylmuramoylalanine--D-glutamate ligase